MAKSYKGLLKQLQDMPEETRAYLSRLENLLAGSQDFDVALAYVFMKLEEGNHRALKCGLVRLLKCDSAKTDEALSQQHFTRPYFRTVFKNVLGKPLPKEALEALEAAEKTRDRLIHGKGVGAATLREAISQALIYIEIMGDFVKERTQKNPCGDLRGLKGRAILLEPVPSYWVLKGVGLYSNEAK